jgi:hypothetical protein
MSRNLKFSLGLHRQVAWVFAAKDATRGRAAEPIREIGGVGFSENTLFGESPLASQSFASSCRCC